LAEATGLSKKQVNSLFDELSKLIANNLGKKGPGVFTLPGLLKTYALRGRETPLVLHGPRGTAALFAALGS
jgi:hypothetical protein